MKRARIISRSAVAPLRRAAGDPWNYVPHHGGSPAIEAASGQRDGAMPRIHGMGPATLAAGPQVRAKARGASVSNAYVRAAVEAKVTAAVGAGIMVAPQHPSPDVRAALSARFNRWATYCDLDGVTDWFGLQAGALRAKIVDGEAFLHLIAVSDTRRLLLRLIPAEMIDHADNRDLPNGGRIVGGIEFDAQGVRVAYHVRELDLSSAWEAYGPARRIPASEMIHLREILGAGQVRGLSDLAAVLIRLGELDELEDASLVGVKTAALFAGFLTDVNGNAGLPFDGTQVGGVLTSGLEPGTLKVLPAGVDIRFSTPAQVSQTVEFLRAQVRAIAVGLGVPSFVITGDLSEANFSSLRAGLVSFRQNVERLVYHTLVPQLLRPVWTLWVTLSFLAGDLDDLGALTLDDLLPAEFIPPAQPWVDPKADIAAIREALAAGIMSRRQAVQAQGWNVEALDAEIAADRTRERALSIGPFPLPPNGQPAAQDPETISDEVPAADQEPRT
ncbi:phage portal protein [Pararoseomonas sp. SCSIO 73927]|uniref:phage portal protein n=1 Tax=Pararoseomonas sp. SCSIO 73927 TaxID=3114537 RepID=UPI0030CFA5FE